MERTDSVVAAIAAAAAAPSRKTTICEVLVDVDLMKAEFSDRRHWIRNKTYCWRIIMHFTITVGDLRRGGDLLLSIDPYLSAPRRTRFNFSTRICFSGKPCKIECNC